MSSMQQKLQMVFPEFFQVKRVKKEIEQILQGKQKYNYDTRMSFSRGHSVTFTIDFNNKALKKYKRLQNEKNFEVKILLKKEYPATHPLIYCVGNTMVNFGLEPFRDYSEFLTVDWSAKFTVMDIIKVIPEFLDGWNVGLQERKGRYRSNELFETERIFSWSFLQTFPVKFVHPNKTTIGLLVISCQSEIILLEQNPGSSSYISKDLIKISELVSIFRSRKSSTEVLLEIKNNNSRSSLIFRSEDSQNIVNCILDYMKLANSFGNEKEEASSDEEENDLDEEISKQSPTKANIEEIKEEIVLYESLVQNKMTTENVQNLVLLLKKAIEFYSAIGTTQFEIYLKKLKTLMGNEMAQALLESSKDTEIAKSTKNNEQINNKMAFQSIIDLI